MNKIPLNIAGLDGGVIIKKGGGGGATINNQEKSVDITENGVTEVKPDAEFTGLSKVSVNVAIPNEQKTVDITENGTTEVVANDGFLSKVIVNTNVASSGGGGGSDMPVIGDGKTYLYIKIADEGRMKVSPYFSQTKANGVTIDWGDGSAPETLSGTGNLFITHKYAAIGDYVISLDPVDGCTLGLGHGMSSYCVMGYISDYTGVYSNMLQAVEIGRNVPSIGSYAFRDCYSLASVVIPNSVSNIGSAVFQSCYSLASVVIPSSVTSIGDNVFNVCYSLASVVIPNSVSSINGSMFRDCRSLASVVIPNSVSNIGSGAFYNCRSLASVVIPNSVSSINGSAFYNCYGMAFSDFSDHTSVPSLGSSAFSSIPSDCKIIVPDNLYDEWIAATNWSSLASKIIKKSDWDASQS